MVFYHPGGEEHSNITNTHTCHIMRSREGASYIYSSITILLFIYEFESEFVISHYIEICQSQIVSALFLMHHCNVKLD